MKPLKFRLALLCATMLGLAFVDGEQAQAGKDGVYKAVDYNGKSTWTAIIKIKGGKFDEGTILWTCDTNVCNTQVGSAECSTTRSSENLPLTNTELDCDIRELKGNVFGAMTSNGAGKNAGAMDLKFLTGNELELFEKERRKPEHLVSMHVDGDLTKFSKLGTRVYVQRVAAKIAKEKAEKKRLAVEKMERDRLAAEKAERERLAAEQTRKKKLAAAQVRKKKKAAAQAKKKRLSAEKAKRERLAAEVVKKENLAATRAKEKKLAVEQVERKRLAAEAVKKKNFAADMAPKIETAAQAKQYSADVQNFVKNYPDKVDAFKLAEFFAPAQQEVAAGGFAKKGSNFKKLTAVMAQNKAFTAFRGTQSKARAAKMAEQKKLALKKINDGVKSMKSSVAKNPLAPNAFGMMKLVKKYEKISDKEPLGTLNNSVRALGDSMTKLGVKPPFAHGIAKAPATAPKSAPKRVADPASASAPKIETAAQAKQYTADVQNFAKNYPDKVDAFKLAEFFAPAQQEVAAGSFAKKGSNFKKLTAVMAQNKAFSAFRGTQSKARAAKMAEQRKLALKKINDGVKSMKSSVAKNPLAPNAFGMVKLIKKYEKISGKEPLGTLESSVTALGDSMTKLGVKPPFVHTAAKPTVTASAPAPKQATPKQATPKQATPKQATPKQVTPKQVTPQAAPKPKVQKPQVASAPKPAQVKKPAKPKKTVRLSKRQRQTLKAAQQGDVKAQYKMGSIFYRGSGSVKRDFEEAVKWYEKAAAQGHASAKRNLKGAKQQRNRERRAAERARPSLKNCFRLYQAEKFHAAANRCKQFAAEGDAKAQYVLGKIHYLGTVHQGKKGMKPDLETAVKWMEASANQGYAPAAADLGEMYLRGEKIKSGSVSRSFSTVAQDFKAAKKWFNVSLRTGDSETKERTRKGLQSVMRATAEDLLTVARRAFEDAKKAGTAKAPKESRFCRSVKRHTHYPIDGVCSKSYETRDYSKALLEWAPLAAKGNALAQYNLGHIYRRQAGPDLTRSDTIDILFIDGLRVPHVSNYARGPNTTSLYYAEWYALAARQGLDRAQYQVGQFSMRLGGPDSRKIATKYFNLAAAQGHSYSQYALGKMAADEATKLKWFRLAAKQGNPRAQKELDARKQHQEKQAKKAHAAKAAKKTAEENAKPEVQLKNGYFRFMYVESCFEIRKSYLVKYISDEQLAAAKVSIQEFENHYMSKYKNIDKDAAWDRASEEFEKEIGNNFRVLKSIPDFDKQVKAGCQLNHLNLTSFQAPGKKKSRKRSFGASSPTGGG